MDDPVRLPPFRLLACDLDGTMLNENGRWTPEVLAFFDQARSAGIHVVPATGRRQFSALPLVEEASIKNWVVVQNGTMVVDPITHSVSQGWFVPDRLVVPVAEFLAREGCATLVYTNAPRGPREFYLLANSPDPSGFLSWYLDYTGQHYTEVQSFSEVQGEEVTRIVGHHHPDILQKLGRNLEAEFGTKLRHFLGLDQTQGTHRLEVLHPQANKWSGVLHVASHLCVEPEEILAIGDDTNDIEMLRSARWSLAAPGANAQAQTAARERIEGQGLEAVLRVLRERLGLPASGS